MSSKPKYPQNGIAHFDISGADAPALQRFYATIFEWKVDQRGPGYASVTTPGGPDGAIVEAEHAGLTLGIAVQDLDGLLERVEAAGGEITMPAVDNGWVTKAQIADVAGNRLNLIQMD